MRALSSSVARVLLLATSLPLSSCMTQSLWDWARSPTSGVQRSPYAWERTEDSVSFWFHDEVPGRPSSYEERDLRDLDEVRSRRDHPPADLPAIEALWQHPDGPQGHNAPFVYDLRADDEGIYVLYAWDEANHQWWPIHELLRDERHRSVWRMSAAVLATPPAFVGDLLLLPLLFVF